MLAIMKQFKIRYLCKHELYCLKGCTISNVNASRAVVYNNKRPMGPVSLTCFSPPKLFQGFCYTRNFILTNLNPLAPRILHAKYQCIPASRSSEEDF